VDTTISVSELSPRLVRLLELLLRSTEPMKVDTIAQALSVSRRTVFRELENAAPVLSASALVSVPGRGIAFSGDGEVRQKLLDALSAYDVQPASKRERLLRLLIELVANAGEIQKLFSYANALNVSESTISHDLDELEPWLVAQGLVLTRKSGIGVRLDGTEDRLRTALVSRFMLDADTGGKSYTSIFDFPGDDIETGVRELLRQKAAVVDWMTSESLCLIAVYLMVMVKRVYDGKIIAGERMEKRSGDFQAALAEEMATETAEKFSLSLPEGERGALALWIQSCRSKQESPLDSGSAEQQSLVQNLTMRIIERFDPPSSAVLKTNEQLTRLLARHLESALPRIESGKFLPNPLEEKLIANYPEVYEKTRIATRVLEEHLGVPVPSNEVSFIQIHFLAALAFLEDRNIKRRVLRAGIVCVSGIGSSYMLAYQIRKQFKDELEVEIADYGNRSSWATLDFLISTIPLSETEKPFVLVQTVLGADDLQKIQEAVTTFAFTEKKQEGPARSPSLEKRLNSMIEIFMQSRKLLDGFSVESIKADCSFDELVGFAAARFAPENPEAVYDALMGRERVTTQVIGELGIVLLHARSASSCSPVFAVIVPEGGMFTADYFQRTRSCVLMLLPQNTPREMTDLMGGISGALVDRQPFLMAVRAGNRDAIQSVLEREISETLAHCGRGNQYQEKRRSIMAEILEKENIVLNQPRTDREEVIRRCGRMLVDSGYVTERYIEGMIKRDNSFSTGIGNFIAIPHGEEDYKKDIIATGIVVLTYPEGIDWHGTPVYLVIGIAAKGDEHLDIMGNIVDHLETGDDVIKFIKSAGIDEAYRMLCGGQA
jgi:mannitol/fructose-specific phosphotransferase system IIA component/transcriptional antiterminator